MLIKELSLHNFRQYKGDQSIVFSQDPEKNVTVILGKNTSGKTTLVQAFRWCLYEDSNFTGAGKSSVINDDIARGLRKGEDATASVRMFLVHKGTTYEIERTARFISKISGSVVPDGEPMLNMWYYTEDGQRRQTPEIPVHKINDILPGDLSEYFFFDGEKISTATNKSNVEGAINTIMGLSPLSKMIDHFKPNIAKSVITNLEASRKDDNSGKLSDLNNQLKSKRNEHDAWDEKYKSFEEIAKTCKDALDDATRKMTETDSVRKDAERIKNLDPIIQLLDKNIIAKENKILETFENFLFNNYMAKLSVNAEECIETEGYSDKGIPGMNGEAIRFLIESRTCVCGKSLDNNPDCEEKLREMLLFLPPQSIGTQIHTLKNNISYVRNSSKMSTDLFDHLIDERVAGIGRKRDNERERDELVERIGKGGGDLEKIKKDYEYFSQNYKETERLKNDAMLKRGIAKDGVETIEREIESASRSSGVNKDIDQMIEYSKMLYLRAINVYEKKSKENLAYMRKTLAEVFEGMYHGVRKTEISENYSVKLSTEGGSYLDKSKGLETVLNFAFVASLLKMARGNMTGDPEGISSEPYPLVMDAVFTNTDDKHIENICKQFPLLAEQAIIALMDKDWKLANKSLEGHLGQIYRIEKKSETESIIIKEAA